MRSIPGTLCLRFGLIFASKTSFTSQPVQGKSCVSLLVIGSTGQAGSLVVQELRGDCSFKDKTSAEWSRPLLDRVADTILPGYGR